MNFRTCWRVIISDTLSAAVENTFIYPGLLNIIIINNNNEQRLLSKIFNTFYICQGALFSVNIVKWQ